MAFVAVAALIVFAIKLQQRREMFLRLSTWHAQREKSCKDRVTLCEGFVANHEAMVAQERAALLEWEASLRSTRKKNDLDSRHKLAGRTRQQGRDDFGGEQVDKEGADVETRALRTREDDASIAEMRAASERVIRALHEPPINEFRSAAAASRVRAGWHNAMKSKYADAARRPWILLTPDPPEPK